MTPEAIYDLSSTQQGMLMHASLSPDSGVYISQLSIDLKGDLDPLTVDRALQQLAARHEVIRSSFHYRGMSQPVQVVHPSCRIPCTWLDWSQLDEAKQAGSFEFLLNEDRQTPFVLERPPLTRLTVCAFGGKRHRLLWTNHHILWDGWSRAILVRDFAQAYVAAAADKPLVLSDPPSTRDLVRWRKAQDKHQAESYWRSVLHGVGETLLLSQDGAPAAVRSYWEADFEFTREESEEVRACAQAAGTTPSVLFETTWAILLHRFTGNGTTVFGVTSSGRSERLPRSEEMVGVLINTLPLCLNISGASSFSSLIAATHRRAAEMRLHEFSSLGEIQQWASFAGRSLFDSILVYESFPSFIDANPFGAQLRITGVRPHERTHYPLTLIIEPGPVLRVRLSYQSDLLTAAGADQILTAFREALLWAVRNRETPIGAMPINRDLGRRIEEWGVPPRSLSDWFEESLASHADRVAIVSNHGALRYAELGALATRCADFLTRSGIAPEQRIALLMERGPEMVAAIVGVTLAGGAYVPLEPEHPAGRLRFILENSGASLLVTDRVSVDWVPDSVTVISWDEICQQSSGATTVPRAALNPDALLYVLYTSGSTGTPKGVEITHGNVSSLIQSCRERFQFRSDDCWSFFHSYAFDFSTWEIWAALLHGAKLVIVPSETTRSPEDFWKLLCEEGVTVLNQTPSAFRSLIPVATRAGAPTSERLRLVVFGGEALEFHMLGPWIERYPLETTRLVNMYGITETTVHVTAHEISEDEIRSGGASWIGDAIDGWSIHLLDGSMHPVPEGIAGEIYVGGAGLARAYHDRPDLTAERFLPDPFGTAGQRLYRSGDRARWLGPGRLQYLGRGDHQVKIRGHRIESGEVEAALLSHRAVQQAAVIATQEEGGARLLGYVVVSEQVTGQHLRDHVRGKLPEYMVPAVVVVLDRLPLTVNGKLDRAALPKPDSVEEEREHVEPRNERERQLADIWARVLGRRRVSVHDNFFQIGGDSIRAMLAISQINSDLGSGLTIRALYEAPSIEALALRISSAPASARSITRAERRAVKRQEVPQ